MVQLVATLGLFKSDNEYYTVFEGVWLLFIELYIKGNFHSDLLALSSPVWWDTPQGQSKTSGLEIFHFKKLHAKVLGKSPGQFFIFELKNRLSVGIRIVYRLFVSKNSTSGIFCHFFQQIHSFLFSDTLMLEAQFSVKEG